MKMNLIRALTVGGLIAMSASAHASSLINWFMNWY
jgi:hypothetical protein